PGCDRVFIDTLAALLAEPSLADALRPLHLTDCVIDAHGGVARDGRWTLAIVPFGGSEIVNRMPSFRRYVRLIDEQAAALSAACLAFETALHGILRG
ncbi:PF11354 domain protein, partial [Burkholderia cenocepacia BC7]